MCTYVRKTNRMQTFLNNLFRLIYPRHVSRHIIMYPILDIVISRHSALSIVYMVPNQPKTKVPTTPHSRDLAFAPPRHPTHSLQMPVQLIDKFSLYNLKMANICGRKM
jgi:hypothetical protein